MVKGETKNKLTRKVVSEGGSMAAGAAIGSLGGPVGTIIGAGVGALAGWLSEKAYDEACYANNGILLRFKCPRCNHEWERYEINGEIVRNK